MKEGWERTEPPKIVGLIELNEMIQPAFPGRRISHAERIGIGFSNTNYKIHLTGSDQPFVVRLFGGDGKRADKELAIAKLVRATVPVADFIYADSSSTRYDQPWGVMTWKEGFLLRDLWKSGSLQDLTTAADAIGRTLANIHAYSFPESGFFGQDLEIAHPFSMDGENFLAFIEESLFRNQAGKWLGESLTQSLWSFCRTYSSLLSESSETPVLVHSDFNGLNILMQQDPTGCSVSAVLDWEFAFSWRRHVDIANMLRYEEQGSAFETHFITAYQEQGQVLEENWRLLSKLEDLIALCDMLNHSTPDTPIRIRDLQRLIARTVQFKPG